MSLPHINPFFPKHAFKFKGSTPASAPDAIAPPPAPPTATATEVMQAKLDSRRQASKKQGLNSTILSRGSLGSNEGANAPAAQQKSTILGGA